jgi:hypothetical protein
MSSTSSPELPPTVEPHEPITRFLRYSRHFRGGRVRHEGLLPADPDPQSPAPRYETSVYRALGATSEELWAICTAHVDQPDQAMKGRGTTSAGVFDAQRLSIDPNAIPHPRHADVIGWPDDKHTRKALAQRIADTMALEARPIA